MERLKERKKQEHRRGDIRKVCEKSKLSPSLFYSAFRKIYIEELNDNEKIILQVYIELLDERKREEKKLKKIIASSPL